MPSTLLFQCLFFKDQGRHSTAWQLLTLAGQTKDSPIPLPLPHRFWEHKPLTNFPLWSPVLLNFTLTSAKSEGLIASRDESKRQLAFKILSKNKGEKQISTGSKALASASSQNNQIIFFYTQCVCTTRQQFESLFSRGRGQEEGVQAAGCFCRDKSVHAMHQPGLLLPPLPPRRSSCSWCLVGNCTSGCTKEIPGLFQLYVFVGSTFPSHAKTYLLQLEVSWNIKDAYFSPSQAKRKCCYFLLRFCFFFFPYFIKKPLPLALTS